MTHTSRKVSARAKFKLYRNCISRAPMLTDGVQRKSGALERHRTLQIQNPTSASETQADFGREEMSRAGMV